MRRLAGPRGAGRFPRAQAARGPGRRRCLAPAGPARFILRYHCLEWSARQAWPKHLATARLGARAAPCGLEPARLVRVATVRSGQSPAPCRICAISGLPTGPPRGDAGRITAPRPDARRVSAPRHPHHDAASTPPPLTRVAGFSAPPRTNRTKRPENVPIRPAAGRLRSARLYETAPNFPETVMKKGRGIAAPPPVSAVNAARATLCPAPP